MTCRYDLKALTRGLTCRYDLKARIRSGHGISRLVFFSALHRYAAKTKNRFSSLRRQLSSLLSTDPLRLLSLRRRPSPLYSLFSTEYWFSSAISSPPTALVSSPSLLLSVSSLRPSLSSLLPSAEKGAGLL